MFGVLNKYLLPITIKNEYILYFKNCGTENDCITYAHQVEKLFLRQIAWW